MQQKGRRIPIHLQKAVTKEIKKLMTAGHLIRVNNIKQDNFISPTVITVKKDNSVKLAMDARILNDNTIKRKAQMPNLEELLGQVSMAISKDEDKPLYISTIDLEYAFGQVKLHPDTSKHCNIAIIGGDSTGYYQFKKGFYGLSDMPTLFQENIDKTLEYQTPAWQDDIIIATRSTAEEHMERVSEILDKLEKAG